MKNYLYETKDDTYKVTVETDDFAENPLQWEDDAQVLIDMREYSYSNIKGARRLSDLSDYFSDIFCADYNENKSLITQISELGYNVLPIYAYSHSGVKFAASFENPFGRWDSGLAGIIYSKDLPIDYLRNCIKNFDRYFNCGVQCLYVNNISGTVSDCCGEWYFDEDDELEIVSALTDMVGPGKLTSLEGKKPVLTYSELEDKISELFTQYDWSYLDPKLSDKLIEVVESNQKGNVMKITANYSFKNIFGLDQTTSSEKSMASKKDLNKIINKLKMAKPGDIVIHVSADNREELEDEDIKGITYITVYYDTLQDQMDGMIKAIYHWGQLEQRYCKMTTRDLKKIFRIYLAKDEI